MDKRRIGIDPSGRQFERAVTNWARRRIRGERILRDEGEKYPLRRSVLILRTPVFSSGLGTRPTRTRTSTKGQGVEPELSSASRSGNNEMGTAPNVKVTPVVPLRSPQGHPLRTRFLQLRRIFSRRLPMAVVSSTTRKLLVF